MPKHFIIKAAAAANDTTEVLIYGDIGASWFGDSVEAAQFVKDLQQIDTANIVARINSYGGSVSDGIAIHNALKRHPANVTVEIDSIAYSIASLIAMAGDTVNMAENALMMIHAPWGGMMGNSAEMRQYADVLDLYAEAMSSSYMAKSGMSKADVMALLTDGIDHYYTASEAKDAGLVDNVTASMPDIAASFDLSRFTRPPGMNVAASGHKSASAGGEKCIPASGATSKGAASSAASSNAADAATHSDPAAAGKNEDKTMPNPHNPAATDPAVPTASDHQKIAAQAKAEAREAEKQRRTEVSAKFDSMGDKYNLTKLRTECLDDMDCTAAMAGEKILAALAKGAEPVQAGHTDIRIIEDERDIKMNAMVDALLARAGVPGIKAEAGNPWRGHKLLDFAKDAVARGGTKIDGMDQMKVVAAAFTQSTSDFPVLLENAMHKALQAAYARAPLTWTRFCARGSVSDFREHKRYQLGSFGNLDKLDENGEFKNKSIPDGRVEGITADTKGNIINLSRKMVINDDLGAFIGLANSLGYAANRTVEADVYALLALNGGLGPVLSDGKKLFDASQHSNISAPAALSMAAIDADRVVMRQQKDISGNDILDLSPSVLLVPVSLGGQAKAINTSTYNPDPNAGPQETNIAAGLFSDIVDSPRLSGTRRYLFADPMIAPVIEVAFLDGNDQPYLEMQSGFDVDGTRYKVRHDYAVGAVGYQGAVTNAGA